MSTCTPVGFRRLIRGLALSVCSWRPGVGLVFSTGGRVGSGLAISMGSGWGGGSLLSVCGPAGLASAWPWVLGLGSHPVAWSLARGP